VRLFLPRSPKQINVLVLSNYCGVHELWVVVVVVVVVVFVLLAMKWGE
jgi:hypothetical protein